MLIPISQMYTFISYIWQPYVPDRLQMMASLQLLIPPLQRPHLFPRPIAHSSNRDLIIIFTSNFKSYCVTISDHPLSPHRYIIILQSVSQEGNSGHPATKMQLRMQTQVCLPPDTNVISRGSHSLC